MKTFCLYSTFILSLMLFSSCSNETMDKVGTNKELSKSSLPDLSTLISYKDYCNHTVSKKNRFGYLNPKRFFTHENGR